MNVAVAVVSGKMYAELSRWSGLRITTRAVAVATSRSWNSTRMIAKTLVPSRIADATGMAYWATSDCPRTAMTRCSGATSPIRSVHQFGSTSGNRLATSK